MCGNWSRGGAAGVASALVMYADDLTPRPRPAVTTSSRNHFMLISTFGPNHHIYSAAEQISARGIAGLAQLTSNPKSESGA